MVYFPRNFNVPRDLFLNFPHNTELIFYVCAFFKHFRTVFIVLMTENAHLC